MTYLLFFTAFALSSIAAYYSVIGLIAIFAASPVPIAIMGSTLELAKIVTVSWLQRNWNTAPKLLKSYFMAAVFILMLITSLGIFGYLSKAHSEQGAVTGNVAAKVSILDEKIKISKDNIDANRKALQQLDEAVDQVMARSTTETGADKAVQIRRSQSKERARLLQEIEAEQKKITTLTEERAPIAAEVRKIEAEVGPIKYIASFIYGETSVELLEKAVVWVIILIIVVFDPLAVLLFIAFNKALEKSNSPLKPEIHYTETSEVSKTNESMKVEPEPIIEPEIEVVKDQVVTEIIEDDIPGEDAHVRISSYIGVKDSIGIEKINPSTGVGIKII